MMKLGIFTSIDIYTKVNENARKGEGQACGHELWGIMSTYSGRNYYGSSILDVVRDCHDVLHKREIHNANLELIVYTWLMYYIKHEGGR